MARTTITRLSTKASQDIAELYRLLDTVHIGHFAVVDDDGHPVVLPTAVVRDGDRMLVHGSTGSRWMRRLATGVPTSLAVTSFDALVVARSFESSMRYRSAVLFGACTPITDADAKRRALDAVVEGLIPGRVAEVRPANVKELAATQVLSLPIAEWSLKVSEGWPDDTDEDRAGTAWAGVLPATTGYGAPLPALDLNDGIPLPESVRRFYR